MDIGLVMTVSLEFLDDHQTVTMLGGIWPPSVFMDIVSFRTSVYVCVS